MHYAHTLPDRSQADWEPLFTPFGEGAEECRRQSCEHCRSLAARHGHLNKVAHIAGGVCC